MSTRCQIALYAGDDRALPDFEVLLYRHHDGGPDDLVPDVLPFLRRFRRVRNLSDAEYCAAWLVHHMTERHMRDVRRFQRQERGRRHRVYSKANEVFWAFLGHGICGDRRIHSDIAYFYRVTPSRIEVYAPRDEDGRRNPDMTKWRLLDTVPIDERGDLAPVPAPETFATKDGPIRFDTLIG